VVAVDHTQIPLAALHITLTTQVAVDQAAVAPMDELVALVQLIKEIAAGPT